MRFFCKINNDTKELSHCYAFDIEDSTAKILVTEESMPWVVKNFRHMKLTWRKNDLLRACINADSVWATE